MVISITKGNSNWLLIKDTVSVEGRSIYPKTKYCLNAERNIGWCNVMFLAINKRRIRCASQTVVAKDQLLHRTSPSISWQDKDSVTVHNMPARNGFLYQWTIKRPSPDAWERGRLVPFAVRLSISPVVRNTPRVQYRRIRASVRKGTEIGTGYSSLRNSTEGKRQTQWKGK